MQRTSLLATLLLLTLLNMLASPRLLAQKEGQIAPNDVSLEEQSTKDLLRQIRTAWVPENYLEPTDGPHREALLLELIRRSDPSVTSDLRKLALENKLRLEFAQQQRAKLRKEKAPGDEQQKQYRLVQAMRSQFDLFTAIRLIEGDPPPLVIEQIEPNCEGDHEPDHDVVGTARNGFQLKLQIKNVDKNRQPIWFKFDGDTRSGRPARWRIHVWDESGNRVGDRVYQSSMGGGLYSMRMLEHDKTFEISLDGYDYVKPLKPGKYKCQVFYHNQITIADSDANQLGDLMLVESAPIEFEIQHGPTEVIRLTREEHEEAVALVRKLVGAAKIRIVYGQFTDKLHAYLNPKTPAGRLRQLGKQAVPAMIEGLENQQLTNQKRAWLISLVDSIMKEKTLRPDSYLGIYESYSATFPGGSSRSSGGEYSRKKQQQLIDRWIDYRDQYIQLEFQEQTDEVKQKANTDQVKRSETE